MGDLAKPEGNGLITLLHGPGGMAIPVPFGREIFLFDTHIAGTSHVVGIKELEPHLNAGDKLDFFRESDNSHDGQAIVIKNSDGVKIGYVPKSENAVFSRLMDAGKLLFGKIASKKMQGNWLKIEIKVFLRE